MATEIQVTIDSADPHVLADWWAEALGWEVEPQDADFIRRMVAEGHATEDETTTHRGALVWRLGTALRSPDPGRPRVLFQRSTEAKAGKNRVHLDLHVGADRREDEVARLLGMGATQLWRASQGPMQWATLADPEGNEFCVA
ncbi:VOC family protein [Trujillonella humicola]|uniref:VOC family protein n=1 Tax=Trujillonella humicola TaxID=3383699 RepID=UPI0039063F10